MYNFTVWLPTKNEIKSLDTFYFAIIFDKLVGLLKGLQKYTF